MVRDCLDSTRSDAPLKQAADAPKGLDEVIQEGLKSLAEEKGFTFEKK